MYTLVVAIRDPLSGEARERQWQFDPTVAPAVLAGKWNALASTVQGLIAEVQAGIGTRQDVPPPL